ncbi:helix-turn-helix domain-containing protein [Rhizobium helianthi]|uniref:Helix-turn-helix domain-containing protein n=1 Tax=Rhizobium helianthi TaxID=1132695 RepID=A0ABW4LZ08_9HYPH
MISARQLQPAASEDTIGGRISLAREALEMTVAQAAEQLGRTAEEWANWESDRCAPPPALLHEIAATLQVTLCWLLTGRGVGPSWEDLLENVPPYRVEPATLRLVR